MDLLTLEVFSNLNDSVIPKGTSGLIPDCFPLQICRKITTNSWPPHRVWFCWPEPCVGLCVPVPVPGGCHPPLAWGAAAGKRYGGDSLSARVFLSSS